MLRRIKNGDKMPPNRTTDAKKERGVIEKEFI